VRDRPLLTVTVTNFNYERFLAENLRSILKQSFTDFELLVIDNASTDGSLELIREFAAEDARIRVVAHEQNVGAFASLRESCELARGKYRLHVDADDCVLDDDAMRAQVETLEAHRHVTFVHSPMVVADGGGAKVHVSRPYAHDVVVPGHEAIVPVLGFQVGHSGMMLRLDDYHAVGGYPSGFRHLDDILLAARLCERGDVAYIDREMYAFRQHGDNAHLTPDYQLLREEILPAIDLVFNGPLGRSLTRGLRKRIRQTALVHLPTQYVFSGQPRVGWRLYWEGVRTHPVETVFQLRTLALVLRTALGSQAYDWLRARSGAQSR
jgi:glycosyltransferase involved in cell wall biosynthesis